jgi:hypothetical protein
MTKAYLLRCSGCQAEISVEPRQAGQFVTCGKCQASLEVPTIGQLKRLPSVGEDTARVTTAIPNPLKPWFFVIGIAAAALLGVCGWLLQGYANSMIALGEMYIESVPPEYFDSLNTQEDLWASWYQFFEENKDLPPWQPSTIKTTRQTGALFKNISWGLLGAGGLGLLLAVTSFFLPNQKTGKRKNPRTVKK